MPAYATIRVSDFRHIDFSRFRLFAADIFFLLYVIAAFVDHIDAAFSLAP